MKKKRAKKYNPIKSKKLKYEKLLKGVGTYFLSGITKVPKCFDIPTGEEIKPTLETLEALEFNTWFWYVDCSVLLREKNLKEKTVSISFQFSSPYYHSEEALHNFLNEQHKKLIDSFGKNKDLMVTAGWIAIPVYLDQYGINSEGQNELPREYLHDFYKKHRGFDFLAKWEADALEKEDAIS